MIVFDRKYRPGTQHSLDNAVADIPNNSQYDHWSNDLDFNIRLESVMNGLRIFPGDITVMYVCITGVDIR